MKKIVFLPVISIFLFLTSQSAFASGDLQKSAKHWKAGVARIDITPQVPMVMSGYAGRDSACVKKLHSLWAKALAFEDAGNHRVVLVTMDLAFLTRTMSDTIKNRIKRKYNLDQSQVILSWSHTHTGPLVRAEDFYDFLNTPPEEIAKVEDYSDKLEDKLVNIAGKALETMVPVRVFSGNGVARFAVNRRNNVESTLNPSTQLSGPVDHSVPVIKVTTTSGEMLAVVFGYACHATTLNGYQWSGDYPGFAQIYLEQTFPGTTAMFFAGSGADQNPLPRRTVGLARQYGKTLAAAVEAKISEPMHELEPAIVSKYTEINLPYTTLPTRAELEKSAAESSNYKKKWASRVLANLERDKTLPAGYPHYPVQIWRLGDQNLVALGGEVVVDYSLRLKQIMGQDIFVMSYANDEVYYIPSTRVLREGGYEGVDVLIYGHRPSTWKANIESLIIQGTLELAEQAGIELPESKLTVN
ncbi:MAG: neutral/alkaline non-lysosomal ceramidase N-terminal domain-containing protein [Bacteroidales bacterium]|nr:neutral/alkaline non-lysosomal ceramidase N-terminal domain-containing protein [Bacteroidales bacterium]